MSETFSSYGIEGADRRTGEFSTVCPECSESRSKKNIKCLSVNGDKGVWHCQHCGWSGGLLGHTDKAASSPQKALKEYKAPKYSPKPLSEKAVVWLAERGISSDVLEQNKIGVQSGGIAFPFLVNGEVVNIKFRGDNKKFWQSTGGLKTVYGYDDISEDCTIIVEGEMDKLALQEAGFKNCVSVPDGAPPIEAKNYNTKFDFLLHCENRFKEVKKFIIATDNDAPGKKLRDELARRLELYRCELVTFPDDCKDANDVLMKHGAETLKNCIEKSYPYPIEGIVRLDEIDMEDFYENNKLSGVSVGWNEADKHFTLSDQWGMLHIVTGVPGSGKSEWMDALSLNLARDEGWRWGIYSPENFPIEMHLSKLMEKHVGLPFRDGFKRKMDMKDVRAAKEFIGEHYSFIAHTEDVISVDEFIQFGKVLCYRQGIRGLICDPWNELSMDRENGQSETEFICESLTKLRRFARAHNCHVFVVAHPQKLRRTESGQFPTPSLYDISGSAHWRNKADTGIVIHRPINLDDPEDNHVEVHISKVRFKHLGELGVFELDYEYSTGVYKDRISI
jgi:twinkle protein